MDSIIDAIKERQGVINEITNLQGRKFDLERNILGIILGDKNLNCLSINWAQVGRTYQVPFNLREKK